jgi:hypothetical protein
MKKKIMLFLALAGVFFASLFTHPSCRRKKEFSEADRGLVRDLGFADASFQDLKSMADEAASGQFVTFKNGQESLAGNCATLIWDTASTPKVITIDFGPVNCLCNDGRYRRGKIIITYTGPYAAAGTVITITPQDYFVNDNQIIGQKVITNQGPNGQGQPTFSVVVDGQVIKTDGGIITWQSTRIRTWISGYDTPQFNDDEYSITGSAQGTSAQGHSFTLTILNPLVRQIGCKWFKSGTLKIERPGKPDILIDYGNGTCDGQIQVTWNGNTYTINLG